MGSNDTVTVTSCSARVRLNLLNDDIFEGRESFFFGLATSQARVQVNGTIPQGEIVITDNDGEF